MKIISPLLKSAPLSKLNANLNVYLKLDNLQPSGSFKIRGVGNACKVAVQNGARKLVSSSGGNAGMAVAYSAERLGVKAVVCVPETTPGYMRRLMEEKGAEVLVTGKVWDDANTAALGIVHGEENASYVPPFDLQAIWDGNASVVEELEMQMEEPDLIVVAVGGGGYLNGVCLGLERSKWKNTKVLAMETVGANSFMQSMEAGKLVTLSSITSVAKSLGALTVSARALQYGIERNVICGAATDEHAVGACLEFHKQHDMMVEPACGASLAPWYYPDTRRGMKLPENMKNVCILVCGGNLTRDIRFK